MRKVNRRAAAALIIAALVIFGTGIFVFRLVTDGGDWASFRSNQAVFKSGVLNAGTLLDRNGVVLAKASEGALSYAEDAAVRTACLHAVGDFSGNIGTGALSAFSDRLIGYDLINGTYSRDGAGEAVELTIDASLCVTANQALAGRKGAVLLFDYTTGEILCMVSSPNYDPQNVPDLTASQYDGAFMNRCISSTYTPGSVFKLVTLAAALENITDLGERSFYCAGSRVIDGVQVNCTGVHGSQTIEQALANSCNCAFSEISLELGADTLQRYFESCGFSSNHSLNGVETAAGSFDKAKAGTAELGWSGIGQSTDLVSPYAMLRYVGAVANGGELVEPTLLKGVSNGKTPLVSAETAARIASMMSYNVQYAYGASRFPGLNICAKTGTAEVGDGTSHSWLVGFLDSGDNPYAFVVVIEHGGGGLINAGSVANSVLQTAVAQKSVGEGN